MIKINPVYTRSIKSRMRGIRAPILISVYLIIVAGIFSLIYFSSNASSYNNALSRPEPVGSDMLPTFYIALNVILFAVIALMVPAMNAGVIASEREKQTLDLLICTTLSARKIITGKLMANLTFVTFLLILVMPLYAIVYLFGGLYIISILKIFLFLIISAYTCASVATFFSSLLKRTSVATILSYVTLILFVIITLVVGSILYYRHQAAINYSPTTTQEYFPFLWRINPIFALLELAASDLPTNTTNMYSSYYGGSYYYGGSFSISSLTGYVSETAYSIYYSSGFMIVASILLNIFSAVLIKPVKKWQMGKKL